MPKINEMIETKVDEISLVTKPAIGVEFDVIKSASGSLKTFLEKLVDMSDQDVINLVRRTNDAYNDHFNQDKGGDTMEGDVLKVLEEKVLKAVEGLQSLIQDVKKDVDALKADKEAATCAEDEKKKQVEKEELEKKLKAGEEAKEEVKKLAESFEVVTKSVESLTAAFEEVKKLGEKVEKLEETEGASNAMKEEPTNQETVNKSADTPSWPSFFK